jgi:hypothetical protein
LPFFSSLLGLAALRVPSLSSRVLNPLPRVLAVRHVSDHLLWLRFADGLEGQVDLRHGFVGPMFEPLHDPAYFGRAMVEHGAVVWPNGADWAPESLRALVLEAKGADARANDDGAPRAGLNIGRMPEISRFFGIIIRMLANDHAPPHFHASYGDYEIGVTIREGIVTGRFPGRALRMVLEWRDLHEVGLLENWERLRRGEAPAEIPPLV